MGAARGLKLEVRLPSPQVARLHGDLAYEGELGPKARAESAAEGAFRKFWLGFAH